MFDLLRTGVHDLEAKARNRRERGTSFRRIAANGSRPEQLRPQPAALDGAVVELAQIGSR